MIVKKHVSKGKMIIAACDDALLGKKIEDDEKIIDLGSSFYAGEKTLKEDFLSLVKKAYIINAAGKETIAALLESKVVDTKQIAYVSGIPVVQILFEI